MSGGQKMACALDGAGFFVHTGRCWAEVPRISGVVILRLRES